MNSACWLRCLLAPAGLTPNGAHDYDPQIHDPRTFARVRWSGTLGLGDAYVDGWWDCERLDELVCRALSARLDVRLQRSPAALLGYARARLMNRQSLRRAFHVGQHHYDLGNDLFAAMLGPTMAYSCAYWKNATDLDAAQRAKHQLICDKLALGAGAKLRLLDIGCGWGSFGAYAAEHYGVAVQGITVSAQQAAYAAQRYPSSLPLQVRLADYRALAAAPPVDRVVSIGMFEHVGPKNYRTFFNIVRRVLAADGLFLLHTIGSRRRTAATDPWIEHYIFPNGHIPALSQIARATEGLFVCEDLHNFGADYDRTLMSWHARFEAAWPALRERGYSERFRRMWRYYLLTCAGAFRARDLQLWQFVFSPRGVPGGYCAVR